MYLRAVHAEFHIPALRRFIRENPLGLLITSLSSPNFPTIQCTHIPWVLDVEDDSSETDLGRIRGHLARQNPHSKAIIEAAAQLQQATSDNTTSPSNGAQKLREEVSVIFNGPAHHYVTPKFYVETKPTTGKVVPTWNYSAVQVYGTATVHYDTHLEETGQFLQRQICDLSKHAETTVMGYERPWSVGDAPERYIELLKKNIIGIDIEITRLEGKYKMSQELGKVDRQGVIKGFEALNTQLGDLVAKTVEERGELKDSQKSVGEARA
ncbi:transcriptional regulator [Cladophialophora psammophila CBS 110553]|uniref:Transcriptional regulator n=1 Tax=Cladophialophora psammophila CBS 110553 TaxID=1182543 RepID=W9X6Y5_9EURO|nr:transcriptional regulator [Cladophialophora psammophila CBS 110553]EXJ66209.1 transcriptional regulator [Cladophialophora psammophila CBS 110553]